MNELGFNAKLELLIGRPTRPSGRKNLGKDGDYVVFAPGWHHAFKFPGSKS